MDGEFFEELFSLLPIIIFIIIFANVKKAKKRAAQPVSREPQRSAQAQAPAPAGQPAPLKAPVPIKPVTTQSKSRPSKAAREVSKATTGKAEKAVSLHSMGAVLEDRNNDWLAHQIREERRIKMRGDFWDIGAAHDKNCDARALKREHVLEHDDSIDDGEW